MVPSRAVWKRTGRAELTRFQATRSQLFRDGLFHYATLGRYTNRARSVDWLAILARYREVDYYAGFLEELSAAGTKPEIAYDSSRIRDSLARLNELLPQIEGRNMRERAARAIGKLCGLSGDPEIKAQCPATTVTSPPAQSNASESLP